MPKGTRRMWMGALLALALGAGQLVAYQGVAAHAQSLLSGGKSGAALSAGRIVARDLSGLVTGRLHAAVGELALLGVRHTSRIYRLAQQALGVSDPSAAAAVSEAGGEDPGCDAAFASEPDMPCVTLGRCDGSRAAGLACPPCPACPAPAAAPGTPATSGRSGA